MGHGMAPGAGTECSPSCATARSTRVAVELPFTGFADDVESCPLRHRIGEPRSRCLRPLVWRSGREPSSHATDECRSPCVSGGIRQHRGRIRPDRPADLAPRGHRAGGETNAHSTPTTRSRFSMATVTPRLSPPLRPAFVPWFWTPPPLSHLHLRHVRSPRRTSCALETEPSLLKRNIRWRKGSIALSSGRRTIRHS